jgi:hypothetical protein
MRIGSVIRKYEVMQNPRNTQRFELRFSFFKSTCVLIRPNSGARQTCHDQDVGKNDTVELGVVCRASTFSSFGGSNFCTTGSEKQQ